MHKLLAVALAIGTVLMVGAITAGATPPDGDPKKVYVCKYVGTPGIDETLQTGQNPIEVSVNAIPVDPVVVGESFADAQGRSLVLGFVPLDPEPSATDCPQDEPTSPPPTPTSPPPTQTDPPTPTSPPPTRTVPPAPVCEPSIGFSRWYGDPQIDITLEGPGRFKVRGGVQRAQHSDTGVDTKVFRVTLACDQTLVIDHYKVHRGRFLYVYLNGALFERVLPPVLN